MSATTAVLLQWSVLPTSLTCIGRDLADGWNSRGSLANTVKAWLGGKGWPWNRLLLPTGKKLGMEKCNFHLKWHIFVFLSCIFVTALARKMLNILPEIVIW